MSKECYNEIEDYINFTNEKVNNDIGDFISDTIEKYNNSSDTPTITIEDVRLLLRGVDKVEFDLGVCFECGDTASEMHHVIPQIRGGKKMLPLCGNCHGRVHGMKRVDNLSDLIKEGAKKAKIKAKENGLPSPFQGRKKGTNETIEKTLSKHPVLLDMFFDNTKYTIRTMVKLTNKSSTTIMKIKKLIKEFVITKEEWYKHLPLSCQKSYDSDGILTDEDINLLRYLDMYWLMVPYYKEKG
tara:strand:+ start:849 stop:1571 length:723 start_codon:yes stop_codon:yes gene_type:complete